LEPGQQRENHEKIKNKKQQHLLLHSAVLDQLAEALHPHFSSHPAGF
jgi:hypothetical protein